MSKFRAFLTAGSLAATLAATAANTAEIEDNGETILPRGNDQIVETLDPESDLYDSEAGIYAPLGNILALMSQHVDVVHFGDTNHKELEATRIISDPGMLATLAEAGISHIMVEEFATKQGLIEDYRSGELPREEMADQISGSYNESTGLWTADLIDRAPQYGMDVHFVDPRGNQPPQNIDGFEERLLRNVVDDSALVANVSNALNGEKGLLVYGDYHGSFLNDTDLNGALDETYAKITVYLNRDAVKWVEEVFDPYIEEHATSVAAIEKDYPELVYFLDTGEVFFTSETPEAMRRDIEEAFPVSLAAERTLNGNDLSCLALTQ